MASNDKFVKPTKSRQRKSKENINEIKVQKRKNYNRASEATIKFICDICGMKFGLRLSLKSHLRIHFNKLHLCPDSNCLSKFTRRKTLSRHFQLIHKNEKETFPRRQNDLVAINCLVCDKPFESVFLLKTHENAHFESKTCNECGKLFSCSKSLRTHQMNQHKEIPNATCHFCGAILRSMDALRGHIRSMHDANSEIVCGICNKKFIHRGSYNDHVVGHLNPKVKECEICKIVYESRQSCYSHKKRKHPELKLDYSIPKIDPMNVEHLEMVKKLNEANDLRRKRAKLKAGKRSHFEVTTIWKKETENVNNQDYEDLEYLDEYKEEVFNTEENENEGNDFTSAEDVTLKQELHGFCKICSTQHSNDDHLALHVSKSHGKSFIETFCFHCPTTKFIPNLRSHLFHQHSTFLRDYFDEFSDKIKKFHSENLEVKCDRCNQAFESQENLEFHKKVMHRPDFCSNGCGSSFEFYKNRMEHEQICVFSFCSICQNGVETDLTEHKREHEKLFCELCLEHFTSVLARQKHNEEYHKKSFKKETKESLHCKTCDRNFRSKQAKIQHDQVHFNSTPLTCAHCADIFKDKRTLITHMQFSCEGLTEKPVLTKMTQSTDSFDWSKVNGAPTNGVGIRKYLKMNTKKKFMCDLCGATSSNEHSAMEHGRKTHGVILAQFEELWRRDNFTNKCPSCNKVFNQLSTLFVHQRTHNMQTFTCSKCGTLLKGQKALMKHTAIHAAKSHACDVCGLLFHLRERMLLHKREKHSVEEQYKCNECGKSFRYGTHFRDHVREHKENDFTKCKICNKEYASRSSLRSHWHLAHPEKFGYWPSRDPKKITK